MRISRSNTKRGKGKDRISELPEPLIHHILSFLPIKSVVSTSVLSTKWRYLWTSTPIIDLHSFQCPFITIGLKETEAFMRFVDRVLSFRQEAHSPAIKKFCLFFDEKYCDSSRVNGWISIVLRHKVEELILTDHRFNGIVFTPCLFTCESLAVLEIKQTYLELPEHVYFPKLKILRLSVILRDQLIQKLLDNSPVLEELSLVTCGPGKQHLSISGPNLKRLFISGYASYRNLCILINAPNLQSFKYSLDLPKDFVAHNFLSLLDAEIVLSCPVRVQKRGEPGYLPTKLFASLSNVKRLTLTSYSLMHLSYEDHFQIKVPSFYNLIHLKVTIACLCHVYGCPEEDKLPCRAFGILLSFLHISPNLESLICDSGFHNYKSDYNDDWSLDFVPQCLLLHLKSIEFCGFFWYQFEKDLVTWFLKNAKVLQSLRITISDESFLSEESNYKEKILNEIAMFPRGSAECVLHVSLIGKAVCRSFDCY